ncbi:hypothetical protein M569_13790, partial [Genlisea aurea]
NSAIVFSFLLLLSFPLLFLFAPTFLPPRHFQISLPDELEDLALFRRAAASGIGNSRNPPPRPRLAFLFLTNTDLHFAPLWEAFFRGNEPLYSIYVHADPSCDITPAGGVFSGRFIAAKKTQRATASLISAARRLIATALLDSPQNSYFALISQHCIPLHSFRFMYDSLFLLDPDRRRLSFIEISADRPLLRERYVARGATAMLPEVPFDRFRMGSQFFVLTRRHAVVVVRDRTLWRKFKLPCLRTQSCYPEEHYFPTLLSMEDPQGCTHYSLTRVNWTGSVDGHPHTYTPAEISPELIRKLRGSDPSRWFMFARKFSPDCLVPLMDVADIILKD